jgi:ketosteroid isomerase-like protein
VTAICLAALLPTLSVACQQADTDTVATTAENEAAGLAAKVDQSVIGEEIRQMLAQHDKALSDKNLDALMGTFSSEADPVVLGTGTEEKWVGRQEIRAAYTEIFKDHDPGTLEGSCDWKTGGADDTGTMAWLAAICAYKDSFQGKVREYNLNVSGSMKKENGNWRFVMLHMSNAFTPPVTK